MKVYTVVMTEPAVEDLKEIADYIARQLLEPKRAAAQIGRLKEAAMELSELPCRNPLIREQSFALQGIRVRLVDRYIIFYTVEEAAARVDIIRILHGKRNWLQLL